MASWVVCSCSSIGWEPCYYCGNRICRAHSAYVGESIKSCHLCCKIDISTEHIRRWSTPVAIPGEIAWGHLYYETYQQRRELLPR